MKSKKYIPLIILPILLLFLAGILFYRRIDTICFERICEDFFEDSLEADMLSLHYTLADPAAHGIQCESASLPVYSREASQQSAESIRIFLNKLEIIRPEKLSETDRYTYKLLSSYFKAELEAADFPYYEEPLSPSSGMHTELPLLLAEYAFRSRKDVQDYLSLLASIPDYLEGLAAFESEKAEAGLFMSEEDAFSAAQQCDEILSEDQFAQKSHFLQTTFTDRLEALLDAGAITQQEQSQFLAENERLLTTVAAPAYQKLGDTLIVLSEKSTAPGGLCRLPEGRSYYAWLVRHSTGCQIAPNALYTLLQKQFQKTYGNLQSLMTAYCDITGDSPDLSMLADAFLLSDPSDILADLQKRMAEDFPDLSALTDREISCTIKNVDTALEAFTSPAYYMTPPVDDLWHNTICINRSSTSEGVELYTTLAHEGYPGHLYQTVYSSLANASEQKIPIRELLYYGGYTEGWAYYVEHLSYTYAGKILGGTEDSRTASDLLCEIAATQRDLQINLFCLLDISLHDQGASKEDIFQTLSAFGIAGDTAERIYDYLRTSPAAYLKYYVGYLEMLALRERAKDLWGDSFTLLAFHRFLLEAGPSDFSSLMKRLEQSGSPEANEIALLFPPFDIKTAPASPTLFYSSSILSRYPLSQSRIFNFFAAATAGSVKYWFVITAPTIRS